MLVPVREEAARIRPELIFSVRSLGAGRRALFRFVYLPACLPAVLTALRLSVGTAVAVLYITEVYGDAVGAGLLHHHPGQHAAQLPGDVRGRVGDGDPGADFVFRRGWAGTLVVSVAVSSRRSCGSCRGFQWRI